MPFQLLGLGVGPVLEAARLLTLSEAEHSGIDGGAGSQRVRLVRDDVVELEPTLAVKQVGLGGDVLLVLLVLGVGFVVVEDGVKASRVTSSLVPTSDLRMAAADAFALLTELNSWSHPTYYFTGCYISFVEFYKKKQKRRGGDPAQYIECIRKSSTRYFEKPPPHVALAVLSPFLPAVDEKHVVTAEPEASTDLDTPNERAPRMLLLGSMRCMLCLYTLVRALRGTQGVRVSTWIAGVALFELVATDLKEAYEANKGEAGVAIEKEKETGLGKKEWARLLVEKSDIDLSSRLDSRIALLRDEIATKRGMVGIEVEGSVGRGALVLILGGNEYACRTPDPGLGGDFMHRRKWSAIDFIYGSV
ncbi:hypothetical protein C8R44DRAFT_888754 [Mycena epipterygia]|nr:hypothetical protein C8R44DRAFT_888754 [Mycena epipterygia]